MNKIYNFDKKRVCDLSNDKRVVEIKKGNCITRISSNPDGTLKINHIKDEICMNRCNN